MASSDYINKVANIISEYHGVHKFITKDLIPPPGTSRAFIVNNADPTMPLDGINNLYIVQHKNGLIDAYCKSCDVDTFGFNNIDEFYRWLENKIYGRDSEVGGPYSALAATLAHNHKK